MDGKTTRLMEHAVSELGNLPDGHFVFVTGPHFRWLKTLEHEFKAAGLMGVKFISLDQIINGGLRGYRGILLIDDEEDIQAKYWIRLIHEKRAFELMTRR